jgi:hypothetical protein
VIENPNGTVSLFGPYSGRFVLQPGQSIKLATPTLDGGTHLFLRLDAIERESDPEKNHEEK